MMIPDTHSGNSLTPLRQLANLYPNINLGATRDYLITASITKLTRKRMRLKLTRLYY